MSEATVKAWLLVMMAVSIPAILLVFFSSLSQNAHNLDVAYKVAILLCTFGLVVQCVRSVYFFSNGSYPVDNFFPLWITKDIGIVILIFRFAQKAHSIKNIRSNKKLKKEKND